MYRLLLLLLPRHRRIAYGDEMRDVFHAALLASSVRGGRRASFQLWIREVGGLMRFALKERIAPGPGRGSFSGSELHWALRSLRSRGWAAVFAVGLLAAALAANGIVFAAVDALAINRTPYPYVHRIVSVVGAGENAGPPSLPTAFARQLVEESRTFERIAAYTRGTMFLQGSVSERVSVINTTPKLFAVLGLTPRWGRGFSVEDTRIHESDVVVISESLARSKFGTPDAAVGQTLDTTDVPLRVVGVMASTFRFPTGGIDVWRGLDLDGPLAQATSALHVIARVPDGQTVDTVNEVLRARTHPTSTGAVAAKPFARARQDGAQFFALLGAALCLLLTACANAAGLELVAASGRAKTYAIQRALGASRSLIMRVVLIEGAILIGVAGCVGVGLAAMGLDALVSELPQSYGVAPVNPIDLDTRALWFMGATATVTWLLTALPVLWFATGVNMLEVVKHGTCGQSGSRFATRFRQGLTGVQVALAVILLVGSILYARTYIARVSVDKGFDSTNLASLSLILPPQDIPRLSSIRASVLARLSTQPGVLAVTSDSAPPLGDSPMSGAQLEIDGVMVPNPELSVGRRVVSTQYLGLIGVTVREGRLLQPDDPSGVVVVSDAFARRFWPDGAVGHSFRLDPRAATNVIVGVVSHIRSNEDRFADERGITLTFYERLVPRTGPPRPATPRPATPQPSGRRIINAASAFIPMTMKLDSPARLPEIVALVRREVPQFAVNSAMISDTYKDWEAETRLQTTVITTFGVLSFLTALVGLYGVMMFVVAGRTRELGIRMALGATKRDVIALVLGSASRMSVGGAIVGVMGAVALSRFVEGQLFGVTALDAATYSGVTLVVIACATVASWLPARRAAHVDPAITLRAE